MTVSREALYRRPSPPQSTALMAWLWLLMENRQCLVAASQTCTHAALVSTGRATARQQSSDKSCRLPRVQACCSVQLGLDARLHADTQCFTSGGTPAGHTLTCDVHCRAVHSSLHVFLLLLGAASWGGNLDGGVLGAAGKASAGQLPVRRLPRDAGDPLGVACAATAHVSATAPGTRCSCTPVCFNGSARLCCGAASLASSASSACGLMTGSATAHRQGCAPLQAPCALPVAGSHSQMVPAMSPLAKCLASGLQATLSTHALWPWITTPCNCLGPSPALLQLPGWTAIRCWPNPSLASTTLQHV